MKNLDYLRHGWRCIIIGSGHSAKDFDTSKFDGDVISINFKGDGKYIVCDRGVVRCVTGVFTGETIGFKQDEPDFYFDDQIDLGNHTGYRALQIAERIYDEIYLIGFDYYDVDGVVHCFGDELHKEWIGWDGFYRDREHYFNLHIDDFNKIAWRKPIYNLNPKSRLRKFPFETTSPNRKS